MVNMSKSVLGQTKVKQVKQCHDYVENMVKTRNVYSVFSTVFLLLLLLVVAVGCPAACFG